jgi:hypothetical protein
MADLVLHPLSLGELLDRALTLFLRRAGAILTSVLAAMVVPLLLIANRVPRLMEVTAAIQRDPRNAAALRSGMELLGGMFWVGVVGVIGFLLARTAVAWIAHKSLLGDRTDAFEGLEKGVRFLPMMLGLILVETAVYGIAMILLYFIGALVVFGALRSGTPPNALPLILWALAVYGTMVFITTGLFVTPSILLAENEARVFGALARSFALTKGRRRTIFGGILVVMIVSTVVYLGLGAAAGMFVGAGGGDATRMMPILFGADVAVNLLMLSYYFVFQMVIYYDLRIRKEGLDLDLAAEPSDPPPPPPVRPQRASTPTGRR